MLESEKQKTIVYALKCTLEPSQLVSYSRVLAPIWHIIGHSGDDLTSQSINWSENLVTAAPANGLKGTSKPNLTASFRHIFVFYTNKPRNGYGLPHFL